MINSHEITFCFQGPVHSYTYECIQNTLSHFPGCRAILSTDAEHQPVVDKFEKSRVFLDVIYYTDHPKTKDHLLRHMANSYYSIYFAQTPYVCKIRTDCELRSNNILKHFVPHHEDDIAVGNWHSYYKRMPFFFSDFIFLGKQSNVLRIFDQKNWPSLNNHDHVVSWLPTLPLGQVFHAHDCGVGCRPEAYIASCYSQPISMQFQTPGQFSSQEEIENIKKTNTYQHFKVFSSSRIWNMHCHKYPDLANLEPHFDI